MQNASVIVSASNFTVAHLISMRTELIFRFDLFVCTVLLFVITVRGQLQSCSSSTWFATALSQGPDGPDVTHNIQLIHDEMAL